MARKKKSTGKRSKTKVHKKVKKGIDMEQGSKIVIKDVKLYDVLDLWRRKPKGLFFADTDAIVVTLSSGVKEIFFTCLKGDGTFSIKTPNRTSQVHRQRLADFIKHYFNVKNPEEYDVKEGIKSWKGKSVNIGKGGFIIL
ncbi:MAG: hypothetical protein ABIH55_01685 [Nanoarchaeota archaeon]